MVYMCARVCVCVVQGKEHTLTECTVCVFVPAGWCAPLRGQIALLLPGTDRSSVPSVPLATNAA